MPRGRGTARVELQELVGDVLHGFLDRGLPPLPAQAAEPVERGERPFAGRGVLLDEVQALDRHEQLRVSRVAHVHHLARQPRVLHVRETGELSEPVVAMHDDVAHLQVAEVREECLRRGLPPRGLGARLAEEIHRREEENARRAEHETRARAAGDDAAGPRRERRDDVLGRSLVLDLVFGEQALHVLALALRRGGEQDREAVLPRARDLLRHVRQPVLERQDRLRSDRNRLARRHGRLERDLDAFLEIPGQPVRVSREARRIGHDASGLSGLPVVEVEDVRRAGELSCHRVQVVHGEDEAPRMVEDVGLVRRQKRQQLLEAVVPARERKVARHGRIVGRRAAVGENALRRLARRARVGRERHRRERHQRERARRPLRVRVERPDRGDGVQVELDAHGLREVRREDVEKTAAHGEIAGLGHEVGALVALVEERFGDARGRHLVARREGARALPEVVGRRQAPEEGARRDDEKIDRAFREARQGPELLAPHLQRRRDLLVRRQCGRRKERHALLAENARGVARKGGGVALVREHDEPSQAERRPHGLEEVGQEARGRPREGHASRRRPEHPRLDPPRQTLHRGRGGERLEQRIPPPRHAADYGRGG